jgi:hypothetical protein
MATSPLFGWQEPDDTSLVKDGAAAMRTLGNAIDSSMGDLLGGTTGQVLSKASNTNMDFTWVTSDDANAIQNAIVDAKGDLIAATAADTPARLAVGANDLILTAASGESTGLKWAGSWVDWTPTLTNMTVGNGTLVARYTKIGKTIHWYFKFTFGSTSSFGAYTAFKLPVAPWSGQFSYNGRGLLRDSGTAWRYCSAIIENDDVYPNVELVNGTYSADASVSSTVPFTWTTNDFLQLAGTYEVA